MSQFFLSRFRQYFPYFASLYYVGANLHRHRRNFRLSANINNTRLIVRRYSRNLDIGTDAFNDGALNLASKVSHEGVHVADAAAYIASGYDPAKNPSLYSGEVAAYTVSSIVAKALGQESLPVYRNNPIDVWNKSWKNVDRERLKAIDKILSRPKNDGGIYGINSKSPDRLFPQFPRTK